MATVKTGYYFYILNNFETISNNTINFPFTLYLKLKIRSKKKRLISL